MSFAEEAGFMFLLGFIVSIGIVIVAALWGVPIQILRYTIYTSLGLLVCCGATMIIAAGQRGD